MPDGSSSAQPVIKPGPKSLKNSSIRLGCRGTVWLAIGSRLNADHILAKAIQGFNDSPPDRDPRGRLAAQRGGFGLLRPRSTKNLFLLALRVGLPGWNGFARRLLDAMGAGAFLAR